MKTVTPCPEPRKLKELLDDRLPAGVQAELTGHLDDCSGCQAALEKLAVGESRLSECVCHIDEDRPKNDSAYWPALAALDSAPTVAQADAAPAPSANADLDFLDPPEHPGYLGSLGHYDVIKVAGRGGMGMVLHAFDNHLQRDVALKVLDPRAAKDEVAQERFCREARAAAKVTHENVVAVHAVEHDEEGNDVPFLVMQLVDGESLEVYLLKTGRLESREIVRIGMQMAAGLAAAHDKGLIHRDIKPGNVLLESGSDRVKLTDFGLARVKEDIRLTQSGMVAGTPLYMAPEQARGEEVDQRSDLFSLGVVLYEMATGEAPFMAKTPLAVLKRLTDENPRPLHELNPDLPQWLANVIEKLLAKNPKDRYQTAREVAEILEQHWALLKTSETICPKIRAARAASRWRTAKLIGAGVALAACSAIIGALALPRWSLDNGGGSGVAEASPALKSILRGNAGPVWAVGFTPNADVVAMAIDDGTVKLWDVAGANVRSTLTAHKGSIGGMAISPDGTLMATASDDTTAKIWDLAARKELFTLQHTGGVRTLAFDPQGRVLATGGRNGTVRLWSVATGQEIASSKGHGSIVSALAFSPDGKTLVSGSGDKTVKLWDAATGDERLSIDGQNGGVYAVAVAPNGTIAAGGWDKIVRLYDINSGSLIAALEGEKQDVLGLAFSPDGRWLASAHDDKLVMLWDVAARKHAATLRGHTATVYAVGFSPDGRYVASAGRDGSVRLWETQKAVPR